MSLIERVPMTEAGAKKLQELLNHLKKRLHTEIVQAIGEARALGDLKENAEYHAAKEEQSLLQGQIEDLESKLARVQIINSSKLPRTGKVVFGTTVHLTNIQTNEKLIYRIVGEDEADLKLNKISFSSPIARAIIGKYLGDTVEVQTPAGLTAFQIKYIDYTA